MGWGPILSQLSGGPRFRKHRKIAQETVGTRYMDEYIPLQKKTTYTFLANVGDTPADFVDHIKRFSASTILGITYGYTPRDANDEFIQLAHDATFESFRYGGPGSSICDLVPFLKYWPTWMPFSFYQKHAAYTRTIVEKLFSLPLEWTETHMAKGIHKSLASDLLGGMKEGKIIFGETLDYQDIKHISGALYAVRRWLRTKGQSASVLEAFLLAMTLNPDVYRKAQKVIDEQIGTDRLIEPSDRENLPYITCLLKEVLRQGVPHLLTQDDVYDRYLLPGGSPILTPIKPTDTRAHGCGVGVWTENLPWKDFCGGKPMVVHGKLYRDDGYQEGSG
ncbi:cytochrome P450 [Thelephora ganbajun]|uniref:Cytochrome P450 n=1 Tax=Thelephora ganbajun TaxID=370292 RepID=A0ACB6ZL92_THEGA|nr:cytochrome P450 [Thelephora ganbajun]